MIYNEYTIIDSDYRIIRFDVKDTTGLTYVVKETYDDQKRVVNMVFFKDGRLIDDKCLPSRIEYEYGLNQITELKYSIDTIQTMNYCWDMYKSIFYLDDNQYIKRMEKFGWVDSTNLTFDSIEPIDDISAFYFNMEPKLGEPIEIWGYRYSYFKDDGNYYVSDNFDYETLSKEYNGELDLKSILIGLQHYYPEVDPIINRSGRY